MCFNTHFNRKSVVICLFLLFFTGSLVFGEEVPSNRTNKNYAGHPHCGLYCLYSILKLEGQTVDFRDLVKPEYLGSRKGSSFEELKQASEDFGLNAVSISRLIPNDLRAITKPTILHVKSGPDKKDYDHFVLYLGEKNGKARIFDPPAEVSLFEFSSLTPKWDGNGLVISSKPIAVGSISASSKKRLFIYAAYIGVVVAVFYSVKRLVPTAKSSRLRFGLSMGQVVSFAMIAVFVGLLFHYFYSGGFFCNAAAIEGIQKAYAGSFVPKITPAKMQKIVARKDTVIVDARMEQDYKAGHIDGAVSLPVNCSDEVYARTVSGLTKNKKIILYCQSAGCQFAEKIALRLKEDGFKNLAIFKGGWVEWQKAAEAQSAKSENQKNEESV
jgi:rhodanese-related sulfurtransferase